MIEIPDWMFTMFDTLLDKMEGYMLEILEEYREKGFGPDTIVSSRNRGYVVTWQELNDFYTWLREVRHEYREQSCAES